MSSDGVEKLRVYLAQTRKQAELSIDTLTQQVNFLSIENEELKEIVENLKREKKELKDISETLKRENSKKWKFQERDDWKCLVESLQSDRTRLQDENSIMSHNLELEREKVKLLEDEIISLTNEIESVRQGSSVTVNGTINHENIDNLATPISKKSSLSINVDNNGSYKNEFSPRNTSDSSSSSMIIPASPDNQDLDQVKKLHDNLTPKATSNALHFELEKVHRKLKYERKVARGEIDAQTEEIKNLRRHLNMIITSRMQQPIPLEYLEHRLVNEQDDDDRSSSKNSTDLYQKFSWNPVSNIFNLFSLIPINLHNFVSFDGIILPKRKSFNNSVEVIHV